MATLSALLNQPSISNHGDILEAANKQLGQSTTDLDTLRIKAISLLQLERYNDAKKLFEQIGQPLQEKANLEWAYTLYKTKSPEAINVAAKGSTGAHQHIQAQAAYTLEDFRQALDIYKSILSKASEDEQLDVKVNVLAADAQSILADRGNGLTSSEARNLHEEASEVYYNAACRAIAAGDLSKAEKQLHKSRQLLEARSDLPEEDKRADMASIDAQRICLLDRQGRKEEARQALEVLQRDGISDQVLKSIANINHTLLNDAANPYLQTEGLEKNVSEALTDASIFGFQKRAMEYNRSVSLLASNKLNAVRQRAKNGLATQSLPSLDQSLNSLSVMEAAACTAGQTAKKAIKDLLPLARQRPDDIGLLLVLVQLYAASGDFADAIARLEAFNVKQEETKAPERLAIRYAPGLVALSAALYAARNQTTRRRQELRNAALFWRSQRTQNPQLVKPFDAAVGNLYKAAGFALLSSPTAKDQTLAAEIFSELYSSNPDDQYTVAGLAASNINDSSPALQSRPEDLIRDIDVSALLRAGIAKAPEPPRKRSHKSKSKSKSKPSSKKPSSATLNTTGSKKRPAPGAATSGTAGTAGAAGSRAGTDTSPRPRKRIRPSRLPKDFDPAKVPDPERWLPLRDRSSYRPLTKGGKKAAKLRREMASQGAASGAGGAGGAGSGSGVDSAGASRPGTPGVASGTVKGKKKKGKR